MKPRYEIYLTQDGSPTLQWLREEDGYSEKMHHSGGALSESLFIYQEALLRTLAEGWPPRILSMGLGLGYNELIAIATLHKAGLSQWQIWSFELQGFLRDEFSAWLKEERPSELDEVYSQIITAIAHKLELNPTELKLVAAAALTNGRLQLRGPFPTDAGDIRGCTCVFYDAFSKKMDPQLWEEQTLEASLGSLIDPNCVLATYAATGALNRALKTLGFRLLPKHGFLGKRESTLAIRK